MDNKTKENILAAIEELENQTSKMDGLQAEKKYMQVLTPLLTEEGYDLFHTNDRNDVGIDAIAHRNEMGGGFDAKGFSNAFNITKSNRIGIQFKYYKSGHSVDSHYVKKFLQATSFSSFNRVLLISNTKFTLKCRNEALREFPVQIELIDIDALKAWVSRLDKAQENIRSEVSILMQNISRRLAEMIAKNPNTLQEIEWRDLERIIAEVFSGLGFTTTLTPPSKDGGKDVILECNITNKLRSYIIEIKHWRSGIKVGHKSVSDFLHVITRENRNAGLFLSTYGYCDNAFEQLTEIEKLKLRFGANQKIVGLCRNYVKIKSGIWTPPQSLEDILFEETI